MGTAKPVVRPITEADLEAVIALDGSITGSSRKGFYTKRWAAMNGAPEAFEWLVAVAGNRVAGFVSTHILDGEFGGTEPTAVIDAIGVLPELRKQGIARALMEALEARLKARHITELRTKADWMPHNLVQFFAGAGFQLAPSLVLESEIATHL